MPEATPVKSDEPTKSHTQDPTALTTEKVNREIEQAISLLRAELVGHVTTINQRLDGMDKALELTEKIPTICEEKVAASEKLFNVELTNINRVLDERHLRRKQWEDATLKAIETAFIAAKELLNEQRIASEKAIDKAEKATAAEIANQRALTHDLKERMQAQELSLTTRINTIESKAVGSSSLWAVIVSGFAVTSVVVGVVVAIIGLNN